MEAHPYIAFIGIALAVIVIPGPSVLLIVANSLRQGAAAGLSTVAGGCVAMLIQLSVVIVGLLSLVSILARGLDVIRWFGTAYICYLGFRRWQTANDWDPGASLQYRPAFLEGFTVALLNPTTLLFFVAFFPQFLDVGVNPGLQLLKLAATFWMLALVFDIGCAILASRIGASFRQRRHIVMRNKIAGGIMVAAALALSMARL